MAEPISKYLSCSYGPGDVVTFMYVGRCFAEIMINVKEKMDNIKSIKNQRRASSDRKKQTK